MNQKSWYAFKNQTDTEAELYLYDEIGFFGVGAKQFIADLRAHKGKHIHLRINSPGGEVVEGAAIYNALSRHEGGVTVHIDALAASMASVIAMSGDPVFMAANGLMMIHDPWMLAGGNSAELRKNADLLDTMKNNLVRAYTKKTGIPEDEISAMMAEETWLDSTTAAALGFIDAIEDGVQAAASMTPEKARARFDKFKSSVNQPLSEPTVEAEAQVEAPVVEEPTPEPTVDAPVVEEPASEELVVETPAEEPAPAELPQNAVDLVASVQALKSELAEVRAQLAQRDQTIELIKAELTVKETEAERLAAAAGVKPADVVAPIGAEAEVKTLLDQFNEITDPTERTRFFKQHTAELKRFSASAERK